MKEGKKKSWSSAESMRKMNKIMKNVNFIFLHSIILYKTTEFYFTKRLFLFFILIIFYYYLLEEMKIIIVITFCFVWSIIIKKFYSLLSAILETGWVTQVTETSSSFIDKTRNCCTRYWFPFSEQIWYSNNLIKQNGFAFDSNN